MHRVSFFSFCASTFFTITATVLVGEDDTLLHSFQARYNHHNFLIATYVLFWIIGCLAGTAFAAQQPGFVLDEISGMIARPYFLAGYLGCSSLMVIFVFSCLYFSTDPLLFFHFFIQGFGVCFCGHVFSLVFHSAAWLVFLLLALPQLLLQVLLTFLILHLTGRGEGITIASAVIFAAISILLLRIYAFVFEPLISALR